MKLFTSVNPDQDKYRRLAGSIITLEGLIGVGKSTLGLLLEKYLNCIGINTKFFPEYICEPLLNQYIGNMDKYAYSFQIIMLQKRLDIYQRAHEYALGGGIAIVDRSLIGDYTFAKMQHKNGSISDSEMDVYTQIMKNEKTIEPTYILYLDCQPQTAFTRMISRGNQGEQDGYKLEYFEDLKRIYFEVIEDSDHTIHIIDWNQNQKVEQDQVKYVLDQILLY